MFYRSFIIIGILLAFSFTLAGKQQGKCPMSDKKNLKQQQKCVIQKPEQAKTKNKEIPSQAVKQCPKAELSQKDKQIEKLNNPTTQQNTDTANKQSAEAEKGPSYDGYVDSEMYGKSDNMRLKKDQYGGNANKKEKKENKEINNLETKLDKIN
ncbi:MAG: hypothetical protein K9M56_07150 [Victivallales bacterium]|nr:hypothetical protein [Victivallales bacterium]